MSVLCCGVYDEAVKSVMCCDVYDEATMSLLRSEAPSQ
jgi:hypothetical protein